MANILIIDDEAAIHLDLGLAFELAGHTVVSAYNATEARRHVKETFFDIVSCDNSMPGGDSGSVLLREFKNYYPCMLRVMVSSEPPSDVQEFTHASFKKPVDSDTIVGNITELLKTRPIECTLN